MLSIPCCGYRQCVFVLCLCGLGLPLFNAVRQSLKILNIPLPFMLTKNTDIIARKLFLISRDWLFEWSFSSFSCSYEEPASWYWACNSSYSLDKALEMILVSGCPCSYCGRDDLARNTAWHIFFVLMALYSVEEAILDQWSVSTPYFPRCAWPLLTIINQELHIWA